MKLRKKISVIIAGLMIMALIPQSVFAAQEPSDEVILLLYGDRVYTMM